jgi:hypothetical protein
MVRRYADLASEYLAPYAGSAGRNPTARFLAQTGKIEGKDETPEG